MPVPIRMVFTEAERAGWNRLPTQCPNREREADSDATTTGSGSASVLPLAASLQRQASDCPRCTDRMSAKEGAPRDPHSPECLEYDSLKRLISSAASSRVSSLEAEVQQLRDFLYVADKKLREVSQLCRPEWNGLPGE